MTRLGDQVEIETWKSRIRELVETWFYNIRTNPNNYNFYTFNRYTNVSVDDFPKSEMWKQKGSFYNQHPKTQDK